MLQVCVFQNSTYNRKSSTGIKINIPNGCFDAYEVKVNKDISKYQEMVKLIS